MTIPGKAEARTRGRRSRVVLGRLALVAWTAGTPTVVAVGVIGWPAHDALASTGTTAPPTSSSTAASSAPPAVGASLLPCSAPRAGAPCQADPSQVQINLPGNTDVTAVQLSWVAEPGRSTGVPTNSPPTILQVASKAGASNNPVACSSPNPVGSGQTAICWNWPGSMDWASGGREWLLNGTYQASPCSGVSSSGACNPSADLGPSRVQVGAPPAPTSGFSATSQGAAVTFRWQPGPEPDLVGYSVTRNSQPIYTCTTNGFGPGQGQPCANPPSFSDSPGAGTWTYQVETLRFGADSSAADVVGSLGPSVVSSVSAPAPGPTGASGGGGGFGSPGAHFSYVLPPIPTGVASPIYAPIGLPGRAPSTAAIGEGEPGVSQSSPNLPYNDNPALGGASAEATGTSFRPIVKAVRNNVDAAAELALAVIALSLAIHAWYVRDELRKAAARVAARNPIDPKGLPST